jgi:ABC-2 type transport system permease protein
MRDALLHGEVAWRDLAVLTGWAGLGSVLASRTFSWE